MRPLPVPGGGHRRYARGDVLALLDEGDAGGDQAAAVYTRVRTGKQAEAGKLERRDCASWRMRHGRAIAWCCRRVTWQRARLGFPYLETRFGVLGVPSVVPADQKPEGVPAELVKDGMGRATRFSAKWCLVRDGRRARVAVKATLEDMEAGGVGG